MLPIVTPEEMAAIDAAAPVPSQVLVERAGAAVSWAALRMLGGAYGRTVNVLCGKGNNGADGRVAARHLTAKGVRVRVFEVASCPAVLPPADLVIDAAYGTGFRGMWSPPDVGDTPVLAVDVPSGVDALTGDIAGDVLVATRTVTFAALKPGLLMPPGSALAGELELADIGLDVGWARANLVQAADVIEWWPERDEYAHKWRSAVRVIAGSSTMTGAPRLVAHAAMRTGAGMVHLSIPGMTLTDAPIEIVQRPLPSTSWADAALASLDRFHAIVVGPGLGRSDDTAASIRKIVIEAPLPMVIDGDGLFALGWSSEGAATLLRRRRVSTVLTPHDGEYALLSGSQPGADRMVAARRLAADSGCTVLLKGAATIVADPNGAALVVTAGDARLATAGTGDVLSGIIGALLAGGMKPLQAAAAGAWLHGQAGRRGQRHGLVASDLPDLIPAVLEELL
jgi:hydroxyethylthiazole kinase-like uncharacterized protein yjeF